MCFSAVGVVSLAQPDRLEPSAARRAKQERLRAMSEFESTHSEPAPSAPESLQNQLWRQAPYLVALVLAIFGVAYSNMSHQPLIGYWEFLAVAIGIMCIVTQWRTVPERNDRIRLIATQTLHWAAVLVAMNIMVVFRVQSMLPAPAVSLVLLTLLALGAFLAGVALLSVQICFLGFAMALAVPAIAWLTQSFLFLILAGLLLVGLGMALWPRRSSGRVARSPGGETS
jgi:protein-S-isoprenylcysteine O-methyltransferase Ste14